MNIEFIDNSEKLKELLEEALIAGLEAAAGEIESQAASNTPVDTGKLKGAWGHEVNESELSAIIGNREEYAIWHEFGTGEFAVEGNGRKGGWFYEDSEGNGHFTYGIQPKRMLWNAFHTKKNTVEKIFNHEIKRRLG